MDCGVRRGRLRPVTTAVIPYRNLTRKTQFIRKSFRDEYLEDLVESGELVVKFGANGGEVYFSES